MRIKSLDSSSGQVGFSLVEIMVGMVIGMLGIIIMMQIFQASEERKRTTTAGGDAQNNAVIALDALQRDITHGGQGFAQLFAYRGQQTNCSLQLRTGVTVPLAPVIINPPSAVIPDGDVGTDRLLVSYGTGNDQPDGYIADSPSAGPTYKATSTGQILKDDWIVHVSSDCTLLLRQVTTGMNGTADVVVAAAPATASLATALFNLGARPRVLAYAVRNGNLTVCNYMDNNCGDGSAGSLNNQEIWRPVVSNVVSLRAQYGRDTSPVDGIADTFNRTTPLTTDRAACWGNISAIRLALVTRSTQYDKDIVTLIARPPWFGDRDLDGNGVGDESADGSDISLSNTIDWQHYRFRIFQTLIPIRNVAWMGAVTGC